MVPYTYINSRSGLENLYNRLKDHERVAVDIEADSMHHFKEKVCLIQVADPDGVHVVDPLGITDLTPFKRIIEDSAIQKVFHGGDFDIRSLHRDFGIETDNIFDTEIACRFIPVKERGLAALLEKYFNVYLEKKFQKRDWSRRPLPEEMIRYSVNDAAYLIPLARLLEAELEAKGRLHWAQEEFDKQARKRHENNRPAYLFPKFKGAGKMDSRTLAVLENLLIMRNEIAEHKDLPPFKIIGSKPLSEMARKKPESISMLKKNGILSKKQAAMYGNACIKAIKQALALDEKNLPAYPKKAPLRLTKSEKEKIKRLKTLRSEKSRETLIEEGFLMNNALINAIAVMKSADFADLIDREIMSRWQAALFGDDIVDIIEPEHKESS